MERNLGVKRVRGKSFFTNIDVLITVSESTPDSIRFDLAHKASFIVVRLQPLYCRFSYFSLFN
jgi:hypothetical protein